MTESQFLTRMANKGLRRKLLPEPSTASEPGGPCFHQWPFAGVGAVCEKCGFVWLAPTIELVTPQPSAGEREKWRRRHIDDLTPERMRELAEAALWLARSALWLHIPQLAEAPASGGFGGTMLTAIEELRKQYPGDFPLGRVPTPSAGETKPCGIALVRPDRTWLGYCNEPAGHHDPHYLARTEPPFHRYTGVPATPEECHHYGYLFVGARPEGEKCPNVCVNSDEPMYRCELPRGHAGPHRQGRHDWGVEADYKGLVCTACVCPKCEEAEAVRLTLFGGGAITPAERAFLRNLAQRYAYQEHECPIKPSELWASARKVVEEFRGK